MADAKPSKPTRFTVADDLWSVGIGAVVIAPLYALMGRGLPATWQDWLSTFFASWFIGAVFVRWFLKPYRADRARSVLKS